MNSSEASRDRNQISNIFEQPLSVCGFLLIHLQVHCCPHLCALSLHFRAEAVNPTQGSYLFYTLCNKITAGGWKCFKKIPLLGLRQQPSQTCLDIRRSHSQQCSVYIYFKLFGSQRSEVYTNPERQIQKKKNSWAFHFKSADNKKLFPDNHSKCFSKSIMKYLLYEV